MDLDSLPPEAIKLINKALVAAHRKGVRLGRSQAESHFDTLLGRMYQLKALNGTTELFKAEWREDQHKRDHGKFSSTGGSSGEGEDKPAAGDADSVSAPAHDHAADYKANGVKAKAFKAWFGDWEGDPANASKVMNPETGEPQETHQIPSTGSEAKGKDGKPLVVYHGTANAGFTAFDKTKVADDSLYGPGFYFTEDQSIAEEYQEKGRRYELTRPLTKKDMATAKRLFLSKDMQQAAREDMGSRAEYTKLAKAWEEGLEAFAAAIADDNQSVWAKKFRDKIGIANRADATEVKSVYLNIRKPFDVDKPILFGQAPKLLRDAVEKEYGKGQPSNEPISYNMMTRMLGSKKAANAVLAELGYDGITHIGGSIMGRGVSHRVWIAFEPHQVKAVDNEGTFDPTDHNINKGTWDESAHKRNHGQFASKEGDKDGDVGTSSMGGGDIRADDASVGGSRGDNPLGESGDATRQPIPDEHLLDGLHTEVPPGLWEHVKGKVTKVAQAVHERLVLATPAFLRLQHVLTTIADHPDDLKRLGYMPTTAGGALSSTPDPIRDTTGIGGTLGIKLAAHVLSRVLVWMRRGMSAEQAVGKAMEEVFKGFDENDSA